VVYDARLPGCHRSRKGNPGEVSSHAVNSCDSGIGKSHKDRRHPPSTERLTPFISRPVTSTPNAEDPNAILAKQRLNRPVSPHLSIYRPQIGWIGSSLHRITGVALSGTLYLWATAYLASPALGWHLESASMVAAMGALPLAAKVLLKTTLALPFTYHCMNGVRHLVWDTGRALTNPAIIKSGWTVVGLSVTSALALAFL